MTTHSMEETEKVEGDLTLANQRILILDHETGHPIDELIGTATEAATTTGTILVEIRETDGIETRGEENVEPGQGHKSVRTTSVALALHLPSGDDDLKVLRDHHRQEM